MQILYFCPVNQKSYTLKEAAEKLKSFCVYRDRCHKEVQQKLWDMNMIPEAQNQIIVDLMQEGFLNEERFARSFARGKFTIKKWGRIRISRELKLRDISKINIKNALSEIDEDKYQETLKGLIEKRSQQLTGESKQRKKRKMLDYLAYRGYEYTLIYEKLRELKFL
jgi:regulatory protein